MKISCIGDFTILNAAAGYIQNNGPAFKAILEEYFNGQDIVFANLEAPITSVRSKSVENKKYVFSASPYFLKHIPSKMVFSIANNHMLDYGERGLYDTIDNLRKGGFHFTGAGKNLEEAGRPVVITKQNHTIGFIAAADKRYQAATKDSPGVFPAEVELLVPVIRELKKQADIVYVSVHMGMEYIPVPTPGMKEIAEQSHQAGANVVFFHHAHCLSGVYVNENQATLWGAGNFVFPEKKTYPFKPWFETAAFHFTHEHDLRKLTLEIVPYKINEYGIPQKPDSDTEKKILSRIAKLSNVINSGKSLELLRLQNILRPSFLQVSLSNYADMARRQGVMQVFRQMMSSVKVLFLKK